MNAILVKPDLSQTIEELTFMLSNLLTKIDESSKIVMSSTNLLNFYVNDLLDFA